ncbi:hypothetical protein LIER_32463 [Lithospermum erythrorhizon]|uniref:Retrotransposon gag domain-containing protein n=1 Tax=Lithospermum erythrorhizon TaxID=34254 RepID=A0AAV3RX14_LITER
MELPLKSLDSYQETADAFVAKFGTTIQSIQDERILMDIRQNINEPLSSYYKRYIDFLLSILAVDDKVAYMTFFNCLAYGKLKKALLVKTPLSKDALTREVKQHIELEDLKKKSGGSVDLRETVLRKDKARLPWKLPVWERIQRDRGQTSRKRAHSPPLLRETWILKAEIEKLIKRGYLKEFVGQDRPRQQGHGYSPPREWERSVRERDKQATPPRATERIDTICRGIAGGGDSRNSRKNYSTRGVYSTRGAITQNEPISFSDNELKGIELPHDNPVVIALLVGNQ